MDLDSLKKSWDELGRTDPFWAVLSDLDKKAGGWDPEEFFATGEDEIASVLDEIDSETGPSQRRHVLDFRCGVGRLSQALGDRFDPRAILTGRGDDPHAFERSLEGSGVDLDRESTAGQ